MQNLIIFACFQPILVFFPPDLWMKYGIFISIVNISANLENIDIDKGHSKNIDIDKEILEILNRLEFGISNRANMLIFSILSGLFYKNF